MEIVIDVIVRDYKHYPNSVVYVGTEATRRPPHCTTAGQYDIHMQLLSTWTEVRWSEDPPISWRIVIYLLHLYAGLGRVSLSNMPSPWHSQASAPATCIDHSQVDGSYSCPYLWGALGNNPFLLELKCNYSLWGNMNRLWGNARLYRRSGLVT